jgi:uncharacterized membrane protein YvbJ
MTLQATIATKTTLMCAKCGHMNDMASHRCAACHAHLHRSFWRRVKSRLRRRVKSKEALIIAVGIIVLIAIVIAATRKKAELPASPTGGVSGDAVQY